MCKKFLLICSIILSSQLTAVKAEIFQCSDKVNASKIQSLKIKRFISNYPHLYIVLSDKIIYFKSPRIVDSNYLITYQPYFLENEEIDIGKPVAGYNHVYLMVQNNTILEELTYELYLDEINHNISSNQIYPLNFDVIPAVRQTDQLNFNKSEMPKIIRKRDSLQKDKKELLKFRMEKRSFVNLINTADYVLILRIHPKAEKSYELIYSYCLNPFSESNLIKCFDDFKIDENREIRFIAITLIQPTKRLLSIAIIDDNDSLIMKTEQFYEQNNKWIVRRMKFNNEMSFDDESGPIPLDELLSCISQVKNEREVKGIYWDKKVTKWIIIIRRNFLIIDEDLVTRNFDLKDLSLIEEKTKTLNFETKNDIQFELFNTVWIKNLKYNSYLVPFKHQVFDIDFEKFKDNKFKINNRKPNFIGHCSGSTLNIDTQIYCFNETDYYHFMNERTLDDKTVIKLRNATKFISISSIFKSGDVPYSDDQRLKFIFNYKDHFFVFMTFSHLFVLDYDNFYSIDSELFYNNVEDPVYYVNKLFSTAIPSKKRQIPLIDSKRSIIKIILIGTLFIILCAILLSSFFLPKPRKIDQVSKRMIKKFRKKSGSSRLEVPKRSVHSLNSSIVVVKSEPIDFKKKINSIASIEMPKKLKSKSSNLISTMNSKSLKN